MEHAFPLPGSPVPQLAQVRSAASPPNHHVQTSDRPFMSNMDEISYWICTKQAPCLYNYDNVIKRQWEEAHCSKPKSVQSITLETPKKKKKRKLSLLDDESISTGQQPNVYFETSQKKNQQTMLASHKSDTLGSDIDFNIKNSSIQGKSKKAKLKKSNRTLHKKNKIVTSTPKVTANLRRSLRKAQRSLNNNNQHNSSFEMYNCEVVNGNSDIQYNNVSETPLEKTDKSLGIPGAGDQSNEKKYCNTKAARTPINGQFDDLSDVSGFTANYIRSTKIHSAKRNLRNKGGRNFIKESQNSHKEDTMLVCVNKSVNTGLPKTPLLNCSTDSSQNIVNLITLKNNNKSTRISRGTSLLKFVDSKNSCKKIASNNIEEQPVAANVNVSFQSKSSVTSRYPKRYKNSPTEPFEKKILSADKRRKTCKNSMNNSDRKENPGDKISRTRSGKCIGLTVRQPENSVLVLSNSVEQVSSLASMNVATPNTELRSKSRRRKCNNPQIESVRRQEHGERRDSVRDKSGFAACFSDSDEDNEPLKDKKFFC